jgi:hypothetical protein
MQSNFYAFPLVRSPLTESPLTGFLQYGLNGTLATVFQLDIVPISLFSDLYTCSS